MAEEYFRFLMLNLMENFLLIWIVCGCPCSSATWWNLQKHANMWQQLSYWGLL